MSETASRWSRVVTWFRNWPGAFTPVCTGDDCPVCADVREVTR